MIFWIYGENAMQRNAMQRNTNAHPSICLLTVTFRMCVLSVHSGLSFRIGTLCFDRDLRFQALQRQREEDNHYPQELPLERPFSTTHCASLPTIVVVVSK